MKFTSLMSKTSRDEPRNETAKNARLLIQAGFIHKEMAGVYAYLPLGLRVVEKIKAIVREEMNAVGGQELIMTSLQKQELWEQTDRWDDDNVDIWFKSKLKNGADIGLAWSHEEPITVMMKNHISSYRDLPVLVYQFQTKLRNELRAKSGIMRGREFVMKDLYSYARTDAEHDEIYSKLTDVYIKVFKRIGIGEKTHVTLASGGAFTQFSHEFQTECDAGEDIIFAVADENLYYNREIAPSKAPIVDNPAEQAALEEVEGQGIIGVAELAKFLKIPVEQTTKTMLFEDEAGNVIAAAVRGDYTINIHKLEAAINAKNLKLASADTVQKITGAEVGYAGLLNLPEEVRVVMDDSMQGRANFEMGSNKTNFHTINVNFGRDLDEPETFYDIKEAREGDIHPESGKTYTVFKAAEVGNIFSFGTAKSESLGLYFTDEDGKDKPVVLGSYGIGITRLMGVIAELFSDEKGLVWPVEIAPAKVVIVTIGNDEKTLGEAENLYDAFLKKDIEVLYDDRDERAGVKLADADLMGIPYRVVVSKRTCEAGAHELTVRASGETSHKSSDDLVNHDYS
jgi:prolyl-tRNA synthetase